MSAAKRQLPPRPHLGHLRKEAKLLLAALQAHAPAARLAEAQSALARDYGFAGWAALKAEVNRRNESRNARLWLLFSLRPRFARTQDELAAAYPESGSGFLKAAMAAQVGFIVAALVGVALVLLASHAHAQTLPDSAGTWQGVLHMGRDLRTVVKIDRAADGSLGAMVFSIDQGPDGVAASSINQQGATVTFTLRGATYRGQLAPDGKSLTGTLTQGQSQGQGQAVALNFERATPETAWATDASPHKICFVTVDKDVRLEVLDWGGSGPALVFLAGLDGTAHVFDSLAAKFTDGYHVYGITRRGNGASSKPDPATADYSAARLGDDVLAVLDQLKLERPVLAGHSFAGEELSEIGSRHPEKVAGLIYLDAAYAYAFYTPGGVNPVGMNLLLDAKDLSAQLAELQKTALHQQNRQPLLAQLSGTSLPQFEKDLAANQAVISAVPAAMLPMPPGTPENRIANAMMTGVEKFTVIKPPVLAFFAAAHRMAPNASAAQKAIVQLQDEAAAAQADAFAAATPSARVVRLSNAVHAVWTSNEAEVIGEMKLFLETLR